MAQQGHRCREREPPERRAEEDAADQDRSRGPLGGRDGEAQAGEDRKKSHQGYGVEQGDEEARDEDAEQTGGRGRGRDCLAPGEDQHRAEQQQEGAAGDPERRLVGDQEIRDHVDAEAGHGAQDRVCDGRTEPDDEAGLEPGMQRPLDGQHRHRPDRGRDQESHQDPFDQRDEETRHAPCSFPT